MAAATPPGLGTRTAPAHRRSRPGRPGRQLGQPGVRPGPHPSRRPAAASTTGDPRLPPALIKPPRCLRVRRETAQRKAAAFAAAQWYERGPDQRGRNCRDAVTPTILTGLYSSVTEVPSVGRVTTRPRRRSSPTARRPAPRLTPYSAVNSRSAGSRSPGRSSRAASARRRDLRPSRTGRRAARRLGRTSALLA